MYMQAIKMRNEQKPGYAHIGPLFPQHECLVGCVTCILYKCCVACIANVLDVLCWYLDVLFWYMWCAAYRSRASDWEALHWPTMAANGPVNSLEK